MMNKVMNIYLKYAKRNKDDFKIAIDTKNYISILNNIFNLSYENIRNIYTYIYALN